MHSQWRVTFPSIRLSITLFKLITLVTWKRRRGLLADVWNAWLVDRRPDQFTSKDLPLSVRRIKMSIHRRLLSHSMSVITWYFRLNTNRTICVETECITREGSKDVPFFCLKKTKREVVSERPAQFILGRWRMRTCHRHTNHTPSSPEEQAGN
jgi:hypothetical protein